MCWYPQPVRIQDYDQSTCLVHTGSSLLSMYIICCVSCNNLNKISPEKKQIFRFFVTSAMPLIKSSSILELSYGPRESRLGFNLQLGSSLEFVRTVDNNNYASDLFVYSCLITQFILVRTKRLWFKIYFQFE